MTKHIPSNMKTLNRIQKSISNQNMRALIVINLLHSGRRSENVETGHYILCVYTFHMQACLQAFDLLLSTFRRLKFLAVSMKHLRYQNGGQPYGKKAKLFRRMEHGS